MNSHPNPALESRTIIELHLTPQTPLHIGAGQEGPRKKLLTLTVNGKETPIIPAESLKGTLRHLASRIAKTMKYGDPTTDIATQAHLKDTHIKRENSKIDLKTHLHQAEQWLKQIWTSEQVDELSPQDRVDLYLAYHCPICRLFGAKGIASKLLIHDAVPQGEWTIKTYISTAISRKTRTVDPRKLYIIEYIPPSPKLTFRTKIIADNITPGQPEAKLLANILKYTLKKGIQVGGLKTAGYGSLIINPEKSTATILKIKPQPQTIEEQIANIKALLQKPEHIQKLTINQYAEHLLK